MLQQAAATTRLHLHGERTAEVEIDAAPALPLQRVAEARELVTAAGDHLWHSGYASVAPGVGVAEVFLSHLATLEADEGGVELVDAADTLVVSATEDGVGVALEGGEGEVAGGHVFFCKDTPFLWNGKKYFAMSGEMCNFATGF